MTLGELLRNLLPFIHPYRRMVVFTLALTLISSLTAQVNAVVLRFVIDSITELVEAGKGLHEGFGILLVVAAILLGKEVINVFIQFGQKSFGERLRIYVGRDLAQTVIERILTYRMAFYSRNENQPGKLQTRIDRGVESLTRLVQNFFIDILPLFTSAAVALFMMFNANFLVGLLAFAVIPVYYQVSRMQARRLRGARREIKDLRESKSQGILGILDSIPVIKSFLREHIEEEKQMGLQTDLTDAQMRIRRTSFIFEGLKTFIEQVGVVGVILLTTYFVLDGDMTVGAIMFHILLFNNVTAPIRRLHMIYDQMNDALVYSEGFFSIMHARHYVERSGSYRPDAEGRTLRGHFELRDVSFTYPGNTQPTLTDVSMSIEPGRITALVGLSGAGKSTLVNLLDTFYAPDSGSITLDGISLLDYDIEYVRANIGLVLQKNHIFNGTVEDNIRYGNPDALVRDVIDAAKRAFIHDQLMLLPDGYQTCALALSGGQQQKIAIARMFLKDPPIIFLDEPTASLDAVSTEQIKASMDAIKQNRTVVVISHSISQIIDADCIYVMQQGRIVEHGKHEALYAGGGAYRDIFDAMARSLNIEKIARTFDEPRAQGEPGAHNEPGADDNGAPRPF